MEKASGRGHSVLRSGMYSCPFLRYPWLILPGLALVPRAQHSPDDFRPVAIVALTPGDCLPGFGLSEPDCAVHICTLARILSLMNRKRS